MRLRPLLLAAFAVPGCGFNVDDPGLDRPVITLDEPPAPLEGGTLVVDEGGSSAVVVDPDRDRLVIVDLVTRESRAVPLDRDLQVSRAIRGADGQTHLLDRTAGLLVTVDAEGHEVGRERVCDAPRGADFDEASGVLHIVCASGEWVQLTRGAVSRREWLDDPDARDVVVAPDGTVFVSHQRAASVRRVRRDGTERVVRMPIARVQSSTTASLEQEYAPNTAVRMVETPSGLAVLHQRARIGTEALPPPPEMTSTYSYSNRSRTNGERTWSDPCDNAVAHVAVTLLDRNGEPQHVALPIRRGVTPVDLAVSQGGRVAVAFAGSLGGRYGVGPQLALSSLAEVGRAGGPTECQPAQAVNRLPGQVTAVAFAGERWVAQVRSPAMLLIEGQEPIALGGQTATDTGHELFHIDLGGGIACATCHPGGADDGHVWNFTATGAVRTQSLEGVVGLPPYHRRGDVPTFASLMTSLEAQMDSTPLTTAHTAAIEAWLESIPRTPAGPREDENAIARGEQVFTEARCGTCHAGSLGTDRRIQAAGDQRLMTPALAGLALRPPYLHDGRALTVGDALAQHPGLGPLDLEARSDLAAYLRSR